MGLYILLFQIHMIFFISYYKKRRHWHFPHVFRKNGDLSFQTSKLIFQACKFHSISSVAIKWLIVRNRITGTSQKNWITWKRSIFFVTHFRKWNPYIIIDSLHTQPLFLEILMVKMVNLYTLNTWLGLILHEVLHQCSVAWRQSVCGTSQV